MLQELRKYNDLGDENALITFFAKVIGNHSLSLEDINTLIVDTSILPINVRGLITFGFSFELLEYVEEENEYRLTLKYKNIIDNTVEFKKNVLEDVVKILFREEYLTAEYFSYDNNEDRIKFYNESFPLRMSAYRNILTTIGFIEIEKVDKRVEFYITKENESLIEKRLMKYQSKMSLIQLNRELENKAIIGEKAEQFVLEYEKKRLAKTDRINLIRQISHIDVSAGYDIVSFDNVDSKKIDRFIEVKAVDGQYKFYWSLNEYNVAKIKEDNYFLYLVEISRISDDGYEPYIIKNPFKYFEHNENWMMETQQYVVKKVL